ncbi:hypothetical protein Cpir12675_002850 [Ceratocystis pirilliformis]|uniref:Uncharacterized protein n=1 Tax=Ceratocystis pirilliformis TaxID=259994 RepID=A0ABR3Z7Q2_9PEZI
MSCNPAYWDELGPEDTSSSTSKSRDFYSRAGVPPSSTSNKAYGQSFAPQSYMDHSLLQHGRNRQNTTRIDRRHSHAIAFSQGSDRDYYDDGDIDDSVAMKRRQAPRRPRRRRSEYDEDGYFSNDSYSLEHSEVDEDSDLDYNSEDDQERVQGQRRHTTGARHRRSSRSQELTADGLNATYDPHRSNPIAIAPPPRRESYLEEQALSARGDRLGGYFPLHEDPSLRIQRSHPFHSASAKARKQSITLAQSAAAQHSAAPRSHHPSISSRLDHGSSLSASISHRRGNSYASTPKQHLEYPSSARCPDPPVAPGHSNSNSAIAWRTIHGFNTSSKPTREPGIPSMTSVDGLDKLAGQYTQLSNSNYEDVDPLDGPRPRTQPPTLNRRPPPSLSPSQEAAEQVDRPDVSSPPYTVPMGKYYPSIYEKSQESRRQAAQSMGMNPNEALYYSSDEYTDSQALPISNPVDSATHAGQHHRTTSKGHQRARSTSTYHTQNYHTPSRSLGPQSPRLNPLGSPGPVTPMDLEAHSFAAAGGGSANSYFDRSCGGAVNPKSPRDPRAHG